MRTKSDRIKLSMSSIDIYWHWSRGDVLSRLGNKLDRLSLLSQNETGPMRPDI